ncbi:MAG: phosphonate ABC transporter, permease protein PhnE [Janthinobacterium lividum]
MMPGAATARRVSPADIAALRARDPRAFGPGPAGIALRWAAAAAVAAWLAALCWWFDITPRRIANGAAGLGTILRQMVPPSPGDQWQDILRGLGESVAMAFLGTCAAAVVAVPLGFLGARNVVVNALAHFSVRRVFDGLRGMDQLIWALAFVRAVGLGPLAGVLAIFAAEVAVLAKLYAEAIETADAKQREGIVAAGGSPLLVVRFGLLPPVLPVMLAQALYQFESNVRSASILGVVGAGGIGLQIAERIKVRYWDQVSFIILLILATVAVIDMVSARVRARLIG